VGEKGVNNVLSAEYHYQTTYRTGATHIRKWFDGCFGQANNYTSLKYNAHITDPDSPMFMFERLDEFLCVSGHSYLVCDAACGLAQKYARNMSIICDKEDWEVIMKAANDAHPNCVIQFNQHMHRNFKEYLAQYYVGTRRSADSTAVRISKARWRNYGIGELSVGGKLVTVAHPGEVWLRYTNDPHEEPQRYDLRVGISAQQLYPDIPHSKVVRTGALPVKGQPLPVWSSLMRELLVYKLDSINCSLRKFDPSDLRPEV
jgi:hypothetical protein